MATREQIAVALLNRLSASGNFKTVGRRNRDPESIPQDQTPALMLLEQTEEYSRRSPNTPAKRLLGFLAIIYYDVGADENAVPAAVVNALLDGFDAALAPDDPVSGFCTLGGLAYSALIEGEVIKAPGDVTGKGLAVVPINVRMP